MIDPNTPKPELKTKVILLSGQQGSGKTTVAETIQRMAHQPDAGLVVVELRFANLIYVMHDFCRDLMRQTGFILPDKNGRLLQLLGTEWGRNEIDDAVWIKAVKMQIARLKLEFAPHAVQLVVVISDCRFRNEFDAFQEALRVRLECPEDVRKARTHGWRETSNHASEIDLDGYANDNLFDLYFDSSQVPPEQIAKDILITSFQFDIKSIEGE